MGLVGPVALDPRDGRAAFGFVQNSAKCWHLATLGRSTVRDLLKQVGEPVMGGVATAVQWWCCQRSDRGTLGLGTVADGAIRPKNLPTVLYIRSRVPASVAQFGGLLRLGCSDKDIAGS